MLLLHTSSPQCTSVHRRWVGLPASTTAPIPGKFATNCPSPYAPSMRNSAGISAPVMNIPGPLTALPRLIMPQPYSASMPGAPRSVAVVLSTVETWSPLMYGKRSINTAAAPATWGAAMEVPFLLAQSVVRFDRSVPLMIELKILVPGADTQKLAAYPQRVENVLITLGSALAVSGFCCKAATDSQFGEMSGTK